MCATLSATARNAPERSGGLSATTRLRGLGWSGRLRRAKPHADFGASRTCRRLKRGSRLPATRELAKQYGVSRGTVVMAFEQLHSEGYLEGRTGDGTYVNRSLPEDLLTAEPIAAVGAESVRSRPALSRLASRLPSIRGQTGIELPRPFSPAPSPDLFPTVRWAQIAARCLRGATRSVLGDRDCRGYPPLREAIAGYLGEARGIRCTADG